MPVSSPPTYILLLAEKKVRGPSGSGPSAWYASRPDRPSAAPSCPDWVRIASDGGLAGRGGRLAGLDGASCCGRRPDSGTNRPVFAPTTPSLTTRVSPVPATACSAYTRLG